jgi:hypothetical protein
MSTASAGSETAPPPRVKVPVAVLTGVPVVGLAAVVVYAAQFGRSAFLAVVGVALLTAIAAMFGGGLLGLLFGIPRSAREDQAIAATRPEARAAYLANTNLEQISDWLTKILVGVGLVQLGSIADGVERLTRFVAAGLGGHPGSDVLALALLTFFTVWGFLVGYMFARTYLPGLFRAADEGALHIQVLQVREELVAVQARTVAQEEHDVRALSLTGRVLWSNSPGEPVGQQELTEAYARASRPVLVQIFNDASTQRALTWRVNKEAMERAIPVLRSLVANDTGRRFHPHFGQLGYALADRRTPDHRNALTMLDEAIKIRDRDGDPGWVLYELVRARCRIALDPRFAAGGASSADVVGHVVADLRAAATVQWIRDVIDGPGPYRRWADLNGVAVDRL